MKLTKVVISELVVLIASVFVFRSLWMILDKHFGDAHLEIMLIFGLIVTVLGFIMLHYCVKCEIKNLWNKNY